MTNEVLKAIEARRSCRSYEEKQISAEELLAALQIKYSVVVVAVLPMLLIYPFLSKYLEKGLLVGAIKG